MNTKSIEQDFAAVMAAYHALPPTAERKVEDPGLVQSLKSNTYCRMAGTTTICFSGNAYCYWFGDTFKGCGTH